MTKELFRYIKVGIIIWLMGLLLVWMIGLFFIAIIDLILPNLVIITIGWCYGMLISTSLFLINIWLCKLFFNKPHRRLAAFFLGLSRSCGALILGGSMFFILFVVNPLFHDRSLFENVLLSDLIGPINFFSALAGASIMMLAIFVNNFIDLNRIKSQKKMPDFFKGVR